MVLCTIVRTLSTIKPAPDFVVMVIVAIYWNTAAGFVRGKLNTVFGANSRIMVSLIHNDFFEPTHHLRHVLKVIKIFL